MAIITFHPMNVTLECEDGISILEAEHRAGIPQDAPCGGNGKCGKCLVETNGESVLACRTLVNGAVDVTVHTEDMHVQILAQGQEAKIDVEPVNAGEYVIAVDIGTTTIVSYLLDANSGEELGQKSMLNPQYPYGMDVISRIQAAMKGNLELLGKLVCDGLERMISELLAEHRADPEKVGTICVVGNPAMQQLFLRISPENLSAPPFAPVLKAAKAVDAAEYLPSLKCAKLLIVPDICGYVGADTMGCVISTGMYRSDRVTLMIDIGTNGEMVLGNKHRMIACSTAAGPALEGARISCGMRGADGAIDHVSRQDGHLGFSVIGGGEAKGICGSGLIDLIACLLESGQINKRGRMQSGYEDNQGMRQIRITNDLVITQDDVREVQMAKGAIAAGIKLLMEEFKIGFDDIDQVILAGAFGSYIRPTSACRIGLIPAELLPKIHAVGNAAGVGSRMMALNKKEFQRAGELVNKIESIELAELPNFQKTFGRCTVFDE